MIILLLFGIVDKDCRYSSQAPRNAGCFAVRSPPLEPAIPQRLAVAGDFALACHRPGHGLTGSEAEVVQHPDWSEHPAPTPALSAHSMKRTAPEYQGQARNPSAVPIDGLRRAPQDASRRQKMPAPRLRLRQGPLHVASASACAAF